MKIKMMSVPYCSECNKAMIYSGMDKGSAYCADRIKCGNHGCKQFGVEYKTPFQCVQLERAES